MSRSLSIDLIQKDPGVIRQLSSFYQATKIPLRLYNQNGKYCWEGELCRGQTQFCRLLHPDGVKAKACQNTFRKAVQESIRWGEAMIGKCCYSLMQITAPLMEYGRLRGFLTASPFLLVPPSELQPDEMPPYRKDDPGGGARFEEALSAVPVVQDKEANQVARMLFEFADDLSVPDLSCLQKVREIQEHQGKIADRIRDLKDLERDLTPSSLTKLSYEQEKEIVAKIRLGDRAGAKEILYRILAVLLTQHFENFELLKISILELLIILTRAAVEAGTKIEGVLGLKYRFITESAGIRDQENLCIWVVQLLENLMDGIYQTRNANNFQRLKKALDFIDRNYADLLSIEQIAREAYLSSSRLSHIMKQELGFTVGDYLTKVRVDRAKRLLEESEFPISRIAQEVGFSDQSYFTKVFKKVERCTPREFRQNVQSPFESEKGLLRQPEDTGLRNFPKGPTEVQ